MFRIIATLGIFPDMKYTKQGYEPLNRQPSYNPKEVITDWLSTSMIQTPGTIDLKLNDQIVLDVSDTLMLSLGIEFGKIVTSSLIQPVKNVGCAKVLGVG